MEAAGFRTIAEVMCSYGTFSRHECSGPQTYLHKWEWEVSNDTLFPQSEADEEVKQNFNKAVTHIALGMWELASYGKDDVWIGDHVLSSLAREIRVSLDIPEELVMGFGAISVFLYDSRGGLVMDEIGFSGHYGQVEARHFLVVNLRANRVLEKTDGCFQMVFQFDVMEPDEVESGLEERDDESEEEKDDESEEEEDMEPVTERLQ